MEKTKNKIPLKLRFFRTKNTGFLTLTDRIISFLKPSKKYNKGIPSKILFIRNDKIGDSLVTLPVLRDLKLNYPDIKIHVLASELNYFIFKDLKFIDKIYIYNFPGWTATFSSLKSEMYDTVVDLVGVNKKLLFQIRKISKFMAGSRTFMLSWIFNYYSKTNWVSEFDEIPISQKIEGFLKDCFGFNFIKRDKSLPYDGNLSGNESKKRYDIFIHLGTSELRKLGFETEKSLIDSLKNYKILVTDGYQTERFNYYNSKYSENDNFKFKLYEHLGDTAADAAISKIILCYDGGQAHYMSQFSKTLVIIGTVSAIQWAPYEFENYEVLRSWQNGVRTIRSRGKFGHIAVYYPIWCCPCFDIGCKEKPCINNIQIEQVNHIISENIN